MYPVCVLLRSELTPKIVPNKKFPWYFISNAIRGSVFLSSKIKSDPSKGYYARDKY